MNRSTARGHKRRPKLMQVAIQAIEAQPPRERSHWCTNGRRIETSWKFAEGDLTRLIRGAEASGKHPRSRNFCC